jgi:hypothetical protein
LLFFWTFFVLGKKNHALATIKTPPPPQKKMYNSRDGFSTKIWGPATWHLLRVISFNYPPQPTETDKAHYAEFIESLAWVLPCRACRDNYPKNLVVAGYDADVFRDRDSFSRFIYRLEQVVYHMTSGHDDLPFSFEDNRDTYECFRAKCGKTKGLEVGCVLTENYIPSRGLVVVVPTASYPSVKSLTVHEQCTKPLRRHSF